jgi:Serine kinase of the HPr protein, regulates carbohydrate metabolism
MNKIYYIVAEHLFCVEGSESVLELLTNYKPFKTGTGNDALFCLSVAKGEPVNYIEEMRQDEEGQDIVCGHTEQGDAVFEFRWDGRTAGWLVCSAGYRQGTLYLSGFQVKAAIDNALMIQFAMASACMRTALFHAAAVSLDGKGYMFLGKSGTGKSTHARLWIQNLHGVELMNDDNPAVSVKPDGTAVVYGTPWSGKTPCYKNISAPLGGIVLLSQAPFNKIARLNGIGAYAAIVPSISGKRWDSKLADGLHDTENTLATNIPVWHLDCLPDADAAHLCKDTIAR